MNKNGFLTEKDLQFIEALKEDERVNGVGSFFNTILAGCDWSDSDDFKLYLNSFFNKSEKKINFVDWCFSFGESVLVGKYDKYFIIIYSEGDVYCIGTELQNIIDITLDYYGDRSDIEEYESRFFNATELKYKEELQRYNNFCANLGVIVDFSDETYIKQSFGFNESVFDFWNEDV